MFHLSLSSILFVVHIRRRLKRKLEAVCHVPKVEAAYCLSFV